MGKYYRKILFGMLLAAVSAGTVFWFYKHEPDALLKICITALILLVGGFVYLRNLIRKKQDLEHGDPAEDEFTRQVRLHASSRAFFLSMYLWFFIFIFHYHFSSEEKMLGIGFMGSVLIYGIFFFHFRKTGCFNEK